MVSIVSINKIYCFLIVLVFVVVLVSVINGTGVVNGVVPEPSERILTIVEKDSQNMIVYDNDGQVWQVWENSVYWDIPTNVSFRAIVRDRFCDLSKYAGVIDAVLELTP